MMKTTLGCLAAAVCARLAFEVVAAQTMEQPALNQQKQTVRIAEHDAACSRFTFAGGVARDWLVVERHNLRDYDERGFDPCFTTVTSQFRPLVSKRADGTWQIEFISEIAEKLP